MPAQAAGGLPFETLLRASVWFFNPAALLYTPGLKVPMPEHLPQCQGVCGGGGKVLIIIILFVYLPYRAFFNLTGAQHLSGHLYYISAFCSQKVTPPKRIF